MKSRQWLRWVWPVVPIFASLLVTSFLLYLFGANPISSFDAMITGAFGDQSKTLSVMAFWVPLLLTAYGTIGDIYCRLMEHRG